MCSGSEAGSYLRLIDFCVTQARSEAGVALESAVMSDPEDTRDLPLFLITYPYIAHCKGTARLKGS